MTTTANRPVARPGGRWALVLWASQLLILGPIVTYGAQRVLRGPAMGSIMWPVWAVSLVWTVAVLAMLSTGRGRRWIVAHRLQLALCGISSLLSLAVVGEGSIRVMSETDVDGNHFFRGHHIPPRRLPVNRVDAAIRQYNSTNASFVIADPLLGWAPRPGVRTSLYTYNSQGLRVKTPEMVYSTAATPGRERIAVFGDSFANGAEVGNDQTWASYAEDALRQVGTNAEVLNFGVNGYGMDQAYLRWRHHGSAYAPSVVVFALQLENAKRNMNLIRPMYVRATENLPFSKPRFVIESGQLRLINSPVVPPEQLPDTIRHLRDWPLAPFEQYFRPADYSPSLWSASLALSFLGQTIGGDKPDDIASSDERELAIRIMEAFRDSVQSSGARFVILYLPKRHELRSVRNTGKAPDDAFLQQIEQRLGLVSAADALLAQSRKTSVDALYQEGGHYSPEGNQVVARFLTEALTSR